MRVVCDLTYEYSGHNVTCDNFFTSYNLGQLLLKRKMTMLGTIRKNKKELPEQMPNKEVHSSSFYFTTDTTVVNYIPKKNKNVTLHHDKEVCNRPDKKPQIILDYNSTKGAVDTLDQLLSTYICKRKTNRWPMIVFYNMLLYSNPELNKPHPHLPQSRHTWNYHIEQVNDPYNMEDAEDEYEYYPDPASHRTHPKKKPIMTLKITKEQKKNTHRK
nr:piggyBac transposable element-derived protein 4-like [Parasteatoda tepidariorum]